MAKISKRKWKKSAELQYLSVQFCMAVGLVRIDPVAVHSSVFLGIQLLLEILQVLVHSGTTECHRFAEGASESVPEGEELAVIVIVVQMMVRVMRCTVNNRFEQLRNLVIRIVNRHCPKVDGHKHHYVRPFVKRKQEDVDVIWTRLQKAVQRMKRVACERRGHFPQMVRLVNVLVNQSVVKQSVNPVNETVGEQQERQNTEGDRFPTYNEQKSVFKRIRENRAENS